MIFTFAGKPGYQQFDFYRYNVAIVPQHVFKSYTNTDIASGNLGDTSKLIGTGPYLYQSGVGASSTTVVWKKRGDWWATKALGKSVGPTYVVDIKNGTNAAALSNLLAGNIDLFNNFAPKNAIKGKFKTYFDKSPYHLGANTTWLFPNTTKAPLNDKAFRRALADLDQHEPDPRQGVSGPREQGEPDGPAADLEQVDRPDSGQRSTASRTTSRKAKAILAAAGYKDTNGDGYVENKDGSPIDLSIVCPNGWSDWMTSIQVIADSAKAAGIKITPSFPEYGTMADDRGHGNFDLLLGNDRQYSNTPWTYYQYIFQLPIAKNQTTVNYERYSNPTAWNLTKALDKTPSTNTKAYQAVMSKLQKTFLQDLPGDSALVQRHVVDGEHAVLDGLAVIDRQAVHADLVAQLLADDEHRHAHQPPPRGHVDAARRTVIGQHPSRQSTGRDVALPGRLLVMMELS